MRKIAYIIACALLLLTSCMKENSMVPSLSADQEKLIGTAVQFDPFVENFIRTKKSDVNVFDGGFNTGDMMYIYRQYYEDGQWIYKTPPGTIYKYTDITNGETGIFDKESWKVYEGKTFKFQDPSYNGGAEYSQLLEKKDSITWESGQIVRFRAWVLSRMSNNLADKAGSPGEIASITYPDYMVCDWVMTSGPTQKIPMAMRHLGCRVSFVPLNSNQFRKIEIATDAADYMRDDNSDTNENDEADKHPETSDDPSVLTAAQCAANVKDVFDRMCWPAGVSMDDMSLTTCLKGQSSGDIKHGQLTEEEIKRDVRRAGFDGSIDSRYMMVSIPYDMSNGPHKDEPLLIPPYTRFKVWMRDVNNGDLASNPVSGAENTYHIFSLSDVKNGKGQQAFPNGITMLPGRSYQFQIGYYYDSVKVYAEDNFSWADQDLAAAEAHQNPATVADNSYDWWIDAVADACERARIGEGYNPAFTISNRSELKAFEQIVNGDFTHEPVLYKDVIDGVTYWYKETITNGDGSVEPVYLDKEDLKNEGYIFYNRYTPSIADRPASIDEEYLQAPYSFFDPQLQSRLTVTLGNDIDMQDLKLPTIGSPSAPFAGCFNGAGHTISNLYPENGQLFGYVNNSTISNLRLESTHPVGITGTCSNSRILGCSVYAPSTSATLAARTLGMCYFVGCIHVGQSDNVPLVDDSCDKGFQMYGCMQAAKGITGAALANITTTTEFIEQIDDEEPLDEITWGYVSCNYYDTELSSASRAFRMAGGGYLPSGGRFHRLQYIRGAKTHVLCAKNDYLIDAKTEWKRVANKDEYYGVAPWRAMNFGIYMYNSAVREENKCKVHYESSSAAGYMQKYPELHSGEPSESQMENVLEQFN